jgi:hypothetical protein
MSIDRLRAHFGFERTPFTKELARNQPPSSTTLPPAPLK